MVSEPERIEIVATDGNLVSVSVNLPIGGVLTNVNFTTISTVSPLLVSGFVTHEAAAVKFLADLGRGWIRENANGSGIQYSWIGRLPLSGSKQYVLTLEVQNDTGSDARMFATVATEPPEEKKGNPHVNP